jgi:hypothetical protein
MSNPFRVLTIDELFALNLPELDWLVEGMCPAEALGLLTAREKAGKGLIAVDLLASVASEEPFLDRAVKCCAVGYFAA